MIAAGSPRGAYGGGQRDPPVDRSGHRGRLPRRRGAEGLQGQDPFVRRTGAAGREDHVGLGQASLQDLPDPPQPAGEAPPQAAGRVFRLVKYDSPAGKLHAYMTPDPRTARSPRDRLDHRRRLQHHRRGVLDARARAENDQTASAYRKAGIVMMFPSLRGGNDNPGPKEGFLGEVDDIIAAADTWPSSPTSTRPDLPRRPQHRRHARPARLRMHRPIPGGLLVRTRGRPAATGWTRRRIR